MLMTVVFLLPLSKRLIEAYQDQRAKRGIKEAIARAKARTLQTSLRLPPVSGRNALDEASLRRLDEMRFEDKETWYGFDLSRLYAELLKIIDSK
ncbi:hypothetical protein [Blastopirellula marina]|uniref:Uncharacterized protein n=1 Tax=Blastopirellula marina TaxID=124 RepID=A0A2S8F4W5_9BACT|nr:hypothetical protein [Blastopirellula marina]PQO27205.1 hypothetical protein C5Y98_28600 [Blastopirellula marina]PTL41352.1 hypothetical protein C5Y97_28615 [Blastopirellula marina]